MGKASHRRQVRRAEFLSRLADSDPERFSAEWTKRLESWSRLARRNANVLVDEHGLRTPPSSDILRLAEQQLAACGKAAFEQEIDSTRVILTHESTAAVASATDPRSYRLTVTGRALAWSESHRPRQ